MDVFMILHADHEQNASTSTVRLAGSSGANPFACISSGIACLWGPAHGGANEAALNMLEEIGTVDNIPEFIRRVKDPNDDIRLMGFGHRVYKNYDPRAKAMQKLCHMPCSRKSGSRGQSDAEGRHGVGENRAERRVFRRAASSIRTSISIRALRCRAMGFPTSMFTVLFAVARTVGWIAQWTEMMEDDEPEDRPPASSLYRCAAA